MSKAVAREARGICVTLEDGGGTVLLISLRIFCGNQNRCLYVYLKKAASL
jgi:hypothetical protein